MNISPLEEYALRCAVQLARLAPNKHLSASKIAEREGISVEYVSKIMFMFRQHHLVDAVRGSSGGFKLRVSPQEMPLKSIFGAIPSNKRIEGDFCEQYGGQAAQCVHTACCSIRPFWNIFSTFFESVTSQLTLADLIQEEHDVKLRLKGMEIASSVAKQI